MGAIARYHPDPVRHGSVGGLLPLARSPVLGSGTPRRPIPSRGLAATPGLGGVGRVSSSGLGALPPGSPIHLIPGIVRLNAGAKPEPTTLLLPARRGNACNGRLSGAAGGANLSPSTPGRSHPMADTPPQH